MKLLLNNKLDDDKDEIHKGEHSELIKDIKLLKPLFKQALLSKNPQTPTSKAQIPRTEIIPALLHTKDPINCPNLRLKDPYSRRSTKIVPEAFCHKLITQSVHYFDLQSDSTDINLALKSQKFPKRAPASRSSLQTDVANPVRPKFTNPYKFLNMSCYSKKSSAGSSSASTKASWSTKKVPKTHKILARKSA